MAKPFSSRARQRGSLLIGIMAGVALLTLVGLQYHRIQKRGQEAANLLSLKVETTNNLSQLTSAVKNRLGERSLFIAPGGVEVVDIGADIVGRNLVNSRFTQETPFGTLWQACLWKRADTHKPYAVVYETATTGHRINVGKLLNAGLDPRVPADFAFLKKDIASDLLTYKQTGATIAPGSTTVVAAGGLGEVVSPCIDPSGAGAGDTRLAALISPADTGQQDQTSYSKPAFVKRELAVTLQDTAFINVANPIELTNRGGGEPVVGPVLGTRNYGFQISDAFYERLVGQEDNSSHDGISFVLVGGGGSAGNSHSVYDRDGVGDPALDGIYNAKTAPHYYVAQGGGGGSGYVRTMTVPKKDLRKNNPAESIVVEMQVGLGTGGAASAVGDTSLGSTCVRVWRVQPDGARALIASQCAAGGENGTAAKIYRRPSDNTFTRAPSRGGNGGSGGGPGFRVTATCPTWTNYYNNCALDSRPGRGGENGTDGQAAIDQSDKPVGIAGSGQGNDFLPIIDGVRFEGPVHNISRDMRVDPDSNERGDPANVKTDDGLIVKNVHPFSFKRGWWDTGGYGICFTSTPGNSRIDPACMSYSPTSDSPNKRAEGRGYGAGGYACWNYAASYGDHCPYYDYLTSWPLGDALDLRNSTRGAHGAVYAYWQEN